MPPVGFEPIVSAGERPQTYALDRKAAGNRDHCKSEVLLNNFIALLNSML